MSSPLAAIEQQGRRGSAFFSALGKADDLVGQIATLERERDAARDANAELAALYQEALDGIAALRVIHGAYIDYEDALRRREHGGVAAGHLVDAVAAALTGLGARG